MIKKFNNQEDLAKDLALFILTKIKRKKKFVLGCPGGRSLKKTYYYLGVLSSKLKISLNHLIIIMMDEYVEKKNNRYQLVDSNAHYSCVRFSRKVIKKLSQKGVKLNITAVYTINQVRKIITNVNRKSKTIISIFSGRMSDVGKDPVPIIKESVRLTKKLKKIDILWASTREAYNFLQAKNLGCEIITMPPKIIEKIENFGKDFNTLTLDTVKGFFQDGKKSKFKI